MPWFRAMARHFLSLEQRGTLLRAGWRVQAWFARMAERAGRLLARLARFLPLRAQAALFDGLAPIGRLDHTRHHIPMVVTSCHTVDRLGACAKEPETVAWIENNLRPGDVFWDVGANVGAYALLAWFQGRPDVQVLAFEPAAATFAALARNVVLNEASAGVAPYCLALGRATGPDTFHYRSLAAGASQHAMGGGPVLFSGAAPAAATPMLVFSVDELVERHGFRPPDLLKLDVDGPEQAILEGAARTLASGRPRGLLVEVQEGDDAVPIRALLQSHGFRLAADHHHAPGPFHNLIFAR